MICKGNTPPWAEYKSFRKLSAGSNNHWHDFLPLYGLHILMGVWDRVQRARADHGGLADVFSPPRPHLHRVYWLCDDKCWQIVCALLFCQTEVKVHDCKLRFSAIARISLLLLLNLCRVYIFFFRCVTTKQVIPPSCRRGNERTVDAAGKVQRLCWQNQWITGNYNFRPKAPEKSDYLWFYPLFYRVAFSSSTWRTSSSSLPTHLVRTSGCWSAP